jgi:hypothetical protein
MRIGLDFDGTVALYDSVFHGCAVEQFRMPPQIPMDKLAIRSWFWQTPKGRQEWIELQGIVYGARMSAAHVAPGLERFLRLCLKMKISVSIISHKTEFPVVGPGVNLRQAACRWLEQNGFYDRLGIPRQEVFFEATRGEKIQRIVARGCSRFVDDLEEVFQEPAFPAGVEKLLYVPGAQDRLEGDIKVFSSWDSIRNHFRKATG